MILDHKYLIGFEGTYSYNATANDYIMEIHSMGGAYEKCKQTSACYKFNFDYIIIGEDNIEFIYLNRVNNALYFRHNKSIKNLVNKLKNYYLYNKRKSIIESL